MKKLLQYERRTVWLQFASAALAGCATRTSESGNDAYFESYADLASSAAAIADCMLDEYEMRCSEPKEVSHG